MKKVNLKKELTDLAGNPVIMSPQDPTPIMLGKAVALVLQSYKGARFDPVKLLDLALAFYNKDSISLDASDMAGVEEIVKQNISQQNGFSCVLVGQLLKELAASPECTE